MAYAGPFKLAKANNSDAEWIRKAIQSEFYISLKTENLDGIEVLIMLKIMDPRLAVIMLPGHGSAEAAEQAVKLGAFDYLTKPYELEELVAKIMAAYAHWGRIDNE